MDKKHICKICNRRFANGKAMGGHMRSHLAKLPLPPKPILPSSSAPPPPSQPSKSSPTLSPSSEVNHMQQSRSIDLHEFSNETDSAKNPSGRRSKRFRKLLPSDMEVGSPSDSVYSDSADETSSLSIEDEDAAKCLVMLSRDKWIRSSTRKKRDKPDFYKLIIDGDEDLAADEFMDEDESDDELYCITNHWAKAKYRCDACNKVFKSHQALGGHRASHKKKRERDEDGDEEYGQEGSNAGGVGCPGNNQIHHQRIFECPFCDKVFQSGQALGGHKKVHFTFLAVPDKVSSECETTSALQMFDLNQPAPEDDVKVEC